MGTLAEDLGANYINDFFRNAVFTHEGSIYLLNYVNYDMINVSELKGSKMCDRVDMVSTNLPLDVLKSFTTFSWPKLGYRNSLVSDQNVLICTYLQSLRSTRRGLSAELLQANSPTPVLVWTMASDVTTPPTKEAWLYNVYHPHFFRYSEAVKMLASDEAIAVAINEDVCLTHSITGDAPHSARFDILFRDRVVGYVLNSGEITFRNKGMVKIKFLRKLLSE